MRWLDVLERRAREAAAAEILLERMLAKIEDLCDPARPAQERAGWSNEGARAWRPELRLLPVESW